MKKELTLPNGETLSLRSLTEEDLDKVVALCEACVGKNLYPKDMIAATIGSDQQLFYLLQTASGDIAGYIYYYLTDIESIAKFAKLDVKQFHAVYPNQTRPVGKIQSVGIRSEYRSNGLATQLIQFALRDLAARSVEAVFIVCWKAGMVVPLKRTLQKFSFEFLALAQKVWYDNTALICPYCKGRCYCDAEVYYKLLD